MEKLALVQDEMEQSQHLRELARYQAEELGQKKQREELWNQEQLRQLESNCTQRSFNSTLDYIEQMQQIEIILRSPEERYQGQDDPDQIQLQEWERGASQNYHYDRNPCPWLFRKKTQLDRLGKRQHL